MPPQPLPDSEKFSFTKRQNDFLKPHLPDYMQALYGENSAVKCQEFIEKMYTALKKEYNVPDSRKEAIVLVKIAYSTRRLHDRSTHTIFRPSTSSSPTRQNEQRRKVGYPNLFELPPEMNSTGTTGFQLSGQL